MNTKNKLKHIFVSFSVGNIYFYSIYSFILFISYFINDSGFPLVRSFLIFWFSVIITKILKSKKRYIFVIVILNSIGYFLSSLWILSVFYNSSSLNSNTLWFLSLLTNSRSIVESMILIMIFFGISLLWFVGIKFGKKSINYELTIQSFERGIFVFFFVAMMTFFLKTDIPQMNLYLLTFFLWGTLSISLCKSDMWIQGNNKGNGGIRLIFLFIMVLSIFILSIITFFIDSLEWATVQGVTIIKTIVNPLSPYIVAFLRFLFARGSNSVLQDTSNSLNIINHTTSGVNEFSKSPFNNFLILCLILVSAFILVILFMSILKILFKKSGDGVSEHESIREILQEILKEISIILNKAKNLIKTLFSSNKDRTLIVEIYSKLIKWGKLRGISHGSSETPFEYAAKLSEKYGQLSNEFETITTFFCKKIYGQKSLDSAEIVYLKKAWKQVNSNDTKGRLMHFLKS